MPVIVQDTLMIEYTTTPHAQARANELHDECLNSALPYSAQLEDEGIRSLTLSLDGLRSAIVMGDLQRGANFHCAALRRAVSLKHELSDGKRAESIRLIYVLVTADIDLQLSMRRRWCALLCKLLRRAKHLHLNLPWRPMFDKLVQHSSGKLRQAEYTSRTTAHSHLSALARCASQARRHWPVGSAAEILDAVEPILCAKDPQLYSGAALLSLLLPTHATEGAVWQARALALWRGSAVEGCIEWELLFLLLFKRLAKDAFVGRAAQVVPWAALLPLLMTRTLLLLHLPGGGSGALAPRGASFASAASALLPSHFPPPMAALRAAARLLVLALPPLPRPVDAPTPEALLAADSGGPEAAMAAASVQVAEEAEAAAEELAAAEHGLATSTTADGAAGGEVLGAAAWMRLRQLLRCLEPYCHPSNTGPWSGLIGYLLQALAQFSSWRVLLERTGLAAAPSRALASADVGVLVRLLAPLTSRALYSKAGGLVVMAQMATRYLAELSPEIVLSPLAVHLVDGLQAVTATHQTPMALNCIALLAPMMLDVALCPQHALSSAAARPLPSAAALRAYAAGPRVMLEVLQLALPGIDANDLDKTASTLRLLQQVLLFVPLAGPRWASAPPLASALASAAPAQAEPTAAELERLGLGHRQAVLAELEARGEAESMAAIEELEAEALALCGWLPEFTRELVARLVGTLDHLERGSEGGRDAHRQGMQLLQWRRTTTVLFQQMSEDVYGDVLPAILGLLRRPSLLDAIKHVGALLHAAALAHPEHCLGKALPLCLDALLKRPRAMPGEEAKATLQPLSNSELRWWLLSLAHLVRSGGAALLPYMGPLRAVLRLTAAHSEPDVADASCKLRHRLLRGLLGTYLAEQRSLPPKLWHSATVRAKPWLVWGWRAPLKPAADRVEAVAATWHVPSAAELGAAAVLVHESLEAAEALAVRLEQDATVVSISGGGGSGAKEPPEGCADAYASPAVTSGAVSSDELRGCLLQLRALAKGALPYLDDEPSGAVRAAASGIAPSTASEVQLFEHPSAELEEDGEGAVEAAAKAPFESMELGEAAHAVAAEAAGAAASKPRERAPPVPPMSSVIAHAGKVQLAAAQCSAPLTRLSRVLCRLGLALAPREHVRHTVLLLEVATLVLSERVSNGFINAEQQMCHLSRRSCAMRGGGRPKAQPRANLLLKLGLRHAMRLSATTFGAAWRTPTLQPLIELQLKLSTHRYSSVRTEAQSGFNAAIRSHPWLARLHLPAQIALLHAPSAESFETKGAIFLLSARSVLKRATSHPSLLAPLVLALVLARDHSLPKLQQRARNLLSALMDATPFPLPTPRLRPLPVLHAPAGTALVGASAGGAHGAAAAAVTAHFYRWIASRDRAAIEHVVGRLLARAAPDASSAAPAAAAVPAAPSAEAASSAPQLHWSKEVGALCGLTMLPLAKAEHRSAFAACVAKGLCSPIAAVRMLSRAALSKLLTPARRRGGPLRVPVEAPPTDVLVPNTMSDAAWAAACKGGLLVDKLSAGWASGVHYAYRGPPPPTTADVDDEAVAEPLRDALGGKRATPLGAVADALLTDGKLLEAVLEWLVTDHKEADSEHGGRELFKTPQDVVLRRTLAGSGAADSPPHCMLTASLIACRCSQSSRQAAAGPRSLVTASSSRTLSSGMHSSLRGSRSTTAAPRSCRRCCRRCSRSRSSRDATRRRSQRRRLRASCAAPADGLSLSSAHSGKRWRRHCAQHCARARCSPSATGRRACASSPSIATRAGSCGSRPCCSRSSRATVRARRRPPDARTS